MKIKKVLLLMALVLVGSVVQGQNNRWLRQADSCLKAGNCDCAQGFYDTYRDLGGGRDKQIERRIADCEKTTTTTTPTTTTTTTTTTPTNGAIKTVRVGNVDLRMVYVEGGTFTMGCTAELGDCRNDERPSHQVTLDGYYIGETEVTQALWREVMGSEPTEDGGWTTKYGRGDNYPAYNVSYEDVQEFIKRLNRKTGCTFRLPTEAEWEYAARGGNKSRGYKYSGSNTLGDVAWYQDNSGLKTHTVKGKQANELGLYDMSGNVWEWCQDRYGEYSSGAQRNPQGPSSGSDRVFRGGGWNRDYCRVSYRNRSHPSDRFDFLGFRLVLVP